jgi:ABC-type branched-subunit amino acid transport system substrate-binding protein
VIGHASTGTTKIALENYKKANLPTIIPIATNPTLTLGCKNCFRLPSNDAAQARAISDYAVNMLNGRSIYIVWDDSESARDYSEFLQSEVVNLIGSKIKFRQPVTFRPMNYEYLLKSISYNSTDVLIFCGYGSMAREFLNGLRFEYLGREKMLTRPKVIMSDGSKIADIKEVSSIFGFETYVAFPSAKLASKNQFSDFHAETPPLGQEKMKEEESYELFGYDALTLFSNAFKKLNRNISRQRLNEALAEETTSTTDLCYRYKFVGGENVDDRYFVYSVSSDAVVQEYDEGYLADVFTGKPMPELLAEYEEVGSATEDVKNLEAILERDSRTKALIVISAEEDTKEVMSEVLQVISATVQNRSLAARITVAVGIGPKRKLQLWVMPPDATPRKPPENYKTYNAGELIEHKQVHNKGGQTVSP